MFKNQKESLRIRLYKSVPKIHFVNGFVLVKHKKSLLTKRLFIDLFKIKM